MTHAELKSELEKRERQLKNADPEQKSFLEGKISKLKEQLKDAAPKEAKSDKPDSKKKILLENIEIIWSEGKPDIAAELKNKFYFNFETLQKDLLSVFDDTPGYNKVKMQFNWMDGGYVVDRVDLGASEGDFNPNKQNIKDYLKGEAKNGMKIMYVNDLKKVRGDYDFEFDKSAKKQKPSRKQTHTEWESEVTDLVAEHHKISNSDAQGIVEANDFALKQAWGKDMTPAQALKHMLGKETKEYVKGSNRHPERNKFHVDLTRKRNPVGHFHTLVKHSDTEYMLVRKKGQEEIVDFEIVKKNGKWVADCKVAKKASFNTLQALVNYIGITIYNNEVKPILAEKRKQAEDAADRRKARKDAGLPPTKTAAETSSDMADKVVDKVEKKVEKGESPVRDIKATIKQSYDMFVELKSKVKEKSERKEMADYFYKLYKLYSK